MAVGKFNASKKNKTKKQGEVGLLLRAYLEIGYSHTSYRGRLVWKYPALFIIHTATEGKHTSPCESVAWIHGRKKGNKTVRVRRLVYSRRVPGLF